MALSNKEYFEAIQEARYFSTYDLIETILNSEENIENRINSVVEKMHSVLNNTEKETVHNEIKLIDQLQYRISIYKTELIDRINMIERSHQIFSGEMKVHENLSTIQNDKIMSIINRYLNESDKIKEIEEYSDSILSGKREPKVNTDIDKEMYVSLYRIVVKNPEKISLLPNKVKAFLVKGSKMFGMSGNNHREALKLMQNINNSLLLPSSQEMIAKIKNKLSNISQKIPPKKLSTI